MYMKFSTLYTGRNRTDFHMYFIYALFHLNFSSCKSYVLLLLHISVNTDPMYASACNAMLMVVQYWLYALW